VKFIKLVHKSSEVIEKLLCNCVSELKIKLKIDSDEENIDL
jgi:hypothetical protein